MLNLSLKMVCMSNNDRVSGRLENAMDFSMAWFFLYYWASAKSVIRCGFCLNC